MLFCALIEIGETPTQATEPTQPPDYYGSGDYNYGSGDYHYGSGDYYYGSGDYYYGSGDYHYGSGDYYYDDYDYEYKRKRSGNYLCTSCCYLRFM